MQLIPICSIVLQLRPSTSTATTVHHVHAIVYYVLPSVVERWFKVRNGSLRVRHLSKVKRRQDALCGLTNCSKPTSLGSGLTEIHVTCLLLHCEVSFLHIASTYGREFQRSIRIQATLRETSRMMVSVLYRTSSKFKCSMFPSLMMPCLLCVGWLAVRLRLAQIGYRPSCLHATDRLAASDASA